jgi:hypothetical protein
MTSEIINPGFDLTPDPERHEYLEYLQLVAHTALDGVLASLSIEDQIGRGDNKTAYVIDDASILLLFNHGTSQNAVRKEFYERKLMHSIFPYLIPAVHLAVFPEGLIIADRAYDHSKTRDLDVEHIDRAAWQTVSRFLDFGIPIDSKSSNFAINPFGEAVYLDTSPHEDWDMNMLTTGLGFLPDDQARLAYGYLSRLAASERIS